MLKIDKWGALESVRREAARQAEYYRRKEPAIAQAWLALEMLAFDAIQNRSGILCLPLEDAPEGLTDLIIEDEKTPIIK